MDGHAWQWTIQMVLHGLEVLDNSGLDCSG